MDSLLTVTRHEDTGSAQLVLQPTPCPALLPPIPIPIGSMPSSVAEPSPSTRDTFPREGVICAVALEPSIEPTSPTAPT